MTAAPCQLRLKNIHKSYARGCVEVLRGVHLDVRSGDFVALTGPSGSGKTTLLHIAAMIDRPDSGEVVFGDEHLAPGDERRRRALRSRHVGMIFQRFCLLPHRSAIDNVIFRCRYLPHDPGALREQATAVLKDLGLGSAMKRAARVLSAGEMQRVAIARAIVQEPRLLIADEPTGNLDAESRASIMDCLVRLNRRGITILMATHNESLLSDCTRHIRCDGGRLEEAA